MEGNNITPYRSKTPRSVSHEVPGQSFFFRPQRQFWLYLAYVGLVIVSLACASLGVRSGDVAIRIHLPTLTRTPLPTLTPTTNAVQVTTVLATDSSQNPIQSDPFTTLGEASSNSPGITPAAPEPLTDSIPVATNPNASAQQSQVVAVVPTNTLLPPFEVSTPTATTAATEASPTPTETPIPTDTPTLTPTPLPKGWVFADMRIGPAPNGRDLLILGILINNTGSAQILDSIDGLFYDSQGQSIDNTLYTLDYPINEVPPGGRIPFQIQLMNHPNAADVDLQVLAEAGDDAPRQDFEFLEVNAAPQGDEFCVAGRVRNPGSKLGSYLLVAAVLYDSENKVINYYYDYFDEALPVLAGEQTQDVTVCVDPLQQEVVRYELAAWGL